MSDLLFAGSSSLGPALAVLATALRAGLAAFFFYLAYKAFSGDATMAADFERWGYPAAFLAFTGACQALGALALLAPQTAFWGAVLLVCVLLGAAATHLAHDPWLTTLSPLAVLVLVCVAAAPYVPPFLR